MQKVLNEPILTIKDASVKSIASQLNTSTMIAPQKGKIFK